MRTFNIFSSHPSNKVEDKPEFQRLSGYQSCFIHGSCILLACRMFGTKMVQWVTCMVHDLKLHSSTWRKEYEVCVLIMSRKFTISLKIFKNIPRLKIISRKDESLLCRRRVLYQLVLFKTFRTPMK